MLSPLNVDGPFVAENLQISFVVTSWNDLWPDYGKSLQVCHIQVFKARGLKLCFKYMYLK